MNIALIFFSFLQVEDDLEVEINAVRYSQPYLIVQCDKIEEDFVFATIIIDGEILPLGHVSYERGVELLIKCSYIFNLKFDKNFDNVLLYYSFIVMNVELKNLKSSINRFHEYIKKLIIFKQLYS